MFASFLRSYQFALLALVLVVSGSILFYGAAYDAPIFDESAHIPAGYGYVRYLDYRLNHEHPPLVKVLSGIPLLFLDLKFPTESAAWQSEVNGQWRVGGQFFYETGNDAERLIFWARVGPVLLTLLTVVLLYAIAEKFLGRWWAFLPTVLYAFSPTVLAHGHYVTTDIGAVFGVLIASFTLIRYIEQPSSGRLAMAGLGFGLAQLAKFSNVLLGPIFIFAVVVYALAKLAERWHSIPSGERLISIVRALFRELLPLFYIFLIGLALIYAAYALFSYSYPSAYLARDITSVLVPFRIRPMVDFAVYLAATPLKPLAVFLFGVMSVLQRTAGGNAAYFLGQLAGKGWWYYFPLIYLLKESVPALLLIALGLWQAVKRALGAGWQRSISFPRARFAEFLMLSYIGIYWLNSVLSPLNIGVRHILPTLPLVYILSAISIRKWSAFRLPTLGGADALIRYLLDMPRLFLKLSLVALLFLWFFIETFMVSPYYLSYFNEFAGGTANGYRYATDSNYDWGQDLYRLRDFVEQNRIQKIAVDYFGGGSPHYTLGDKTEGWWSSRGDPREAGIEWLAISANTLSGALGKITPGFERKTDDEYRWLQAIRDPWQPDARAGYSIFIYHLK